MTTHFAEWIAGLGPGIANHLWQSTALLVAAWLVTVALRQNQARVRYAVWLAASLKFLVPFSLLMAAGDLLPHPKQAVAPVVYSAMDGLEEPFADVVPQYVAPLVHVPTMRERIEAELPIALSALWLLGAGIVVVRWGCGWTIARRTLRGAEVTNEGREWEILRRLEGAGSRGIGLRLSAERMEPGVFGVRRPVLVWPRELSERLSDEHIEAIVAHELAHVRRRDNLTAALHMLAEAVFWFHPAVWWMERQMVKEREQACDEAVVAMGGDQEVYAESLLKTCRFCIESPLVCVAGVTGADLKQRVVEIVTGRALLQMSWAKKTLLAAAAICAVAAPVVLGQAKTAQRLMLAAINAAPKPVQTMAKAMMAEASASPSDASVDAQPALPTDTAAPTDEEMSLGPAFEVATIRPADRNDGRRSFGSMVDSSGRFTGSAVTLTSLVDFAYAKDPLKSKISGGPKWAGSDFFDVNAKIDSAYMDGWDKLTYDQRLALLKPMIRTLLVQRFRLKLHTEMVPTPVYALVQAKGGAKVKEVPAPDPADSDPATMVRWMKENPGKGRPGGVFCTGNSCIATAARISNNVIQIGANAHADRMVVDETGLKGYYDFTIPMPAHDDEDAMAEVSEALGLKFEPRTMPVKTYVIDSAEKPSVDGAEVDSAPLLKYLAENVGDEGQLSGGYRKWLDEDVHWLITQQERTDFLKLTTDKDRDSFMDSFWERRDPPGAAKDTYKAEVYTRIAYANEHFASAGRPGWATDRGRAYIVYGKPDSIEAHPSDGYEVWNYSHLAGVGGSASLKFVSKDGDYQLQGAWPQASVTRAAGAAAAFAAVTIKPPDPAVQGHPISFYGKAGGLVFYGGGAKMLIEYAYNVFPFQIAGGPDWIDPQNKPGPDWFEINAVPPDDSPSRTIKVANAEPTAEQREMLRTLLRDRFGLQCHFETKEGEVYILTRGTKPLQFAPPKNPDSDPRAIVFAKASDERPGVFYDGEAVGNNTTTDYIAYMFSRYLKLPVLNQTGITGSWDYHLATVDPDNQSAQDAVNSVVDRLGLKIQRGRGPIQTLVIDRIERPTEN